MKLTLRAFIIAALLPGLSFAAGLTNADIVKMSEAKLDESIIITSIENTAPNYDTSPTGLIGLAAAKVSQPVIAAMIKRNAASEEQIPTAKDEPKKPAETELMSPSEVFIVDGDKTTSMRYLNPQSRTGLRALGYGGIATYAVLRSTKANARISNQKPSFLVSVPDQAQPESYLTLASFAVRKNNTREVMVGGGVMSYSSGVHPDRVIMVDSDKASDQRKAQKGFTIYRVTPRKPLSAGEYAVILYTGEMSSLLSAWFSGVGNSYFDFGVD